MSDSHGAGPPTGAARAPDPAAPLRVLLVEDDVLLGTLLEELLAGRPAVELVATAHTATDAEVAVARTKPDVVLLDIGLPDRSGLELHADLLAARPGLRVLMLTLADDPTTALAAFRAGAIGYIPKRLAMHSLGEALEAARRGHPWLDPEMTLALLGELRRLSAALAELQRPDAALTARERQVADAVAQGRTDEAIASELALSPHTVRVHIKRIRHKLGLGNRAALAAFIAGQVRPKVG
jgi:DNA-binding NarL/FixJ family response regulator